MTLISPGQRDADILNRIRMLQRDVARLETLEFPEEIIIVQDEGVTLEGERFGEMNFMGAGVVASVNPSNDAKVDVTVPGGNGGVITACQLETQNWNIGATTGRITIPWVDEVYDPGGMWGAGDQTKIFMTSQGYWVCMFGAAVRCTPARLNANVNKIINTQGIIRIYPGPWAAISAPGGSLFALTVNWEKEYGPAQAIIGYRHDGTLTNPYFVCYIDIEHTGGAWAPNLPDVWADIWGWGAKIGDLET